MDEIQGPSDDAAQPPLNLAPGDPDSPAFDLQNSDLQDSDLEGDALRAECGVFGAVGPPEGAAITADGKNALQPRGQEAAGIVSFDGALFHSERRLGLV